MHPILANAEAMENLKMGAEQALKHASYEITFSLEDKEKIVHLEARFNKTQSDEVIIIVRDISDIVELQKHTLLYSTLTQLVNSTIEGGLIQK